MESFGCSPLNRSTLSGNPALYPLLNTTMSGYVGMTGQRYSSTNQMMEDLAKELVESTDPYLTKETLVLRHLKHLTETVFNLSWSKVLETVRQGQYYLDRESHAILKKLLSTVTSHDETLERIAAKDYVKSSDVVRLASIFSSSLETNLDVCRLFAVDGYFGFHDLKLYVSHFKYSEDYKSLHVRAVRKLYESHHLNAKQVHHVINQVFNVNTENEESSSVIEDAKNTYLNIVGTERVFVIRDWKLNGKERTAANEPVTTTISLKRPKTYNKKKVSVNDKTIIPSNVDSEEENVPKAKCQKMDGQEKKDKKKKDLTGKKTLDTKKLREGKKKKQLFDEALGNVNVIKVTASMENDEDGKTLKELIETASK